MIIGQTLHISFDDSFFSVRLSDKETDPPSISPGRIIFAFSLSMHSDTFAFRHSLSYVRPASYPYPDSINPNIPNSPPSFHLCSERDFPSKVRLLYNYINIHHQCDLRRSCRLWLANRLITASFNTPPIRLSIRHAISLHALKRVYPSTKCARNVHDAPTSLPAKGQPAAKNPTRIGSPAILSLTWLAIFKSDAWPI